MSKYKINLVKNHNFDFIRKICLLILLGFSHLLVTIIAIILLDIHTFYSSNHNFNPRNLVNQVMRFNKCFKVL